MLLSVIIINYKTVDITKSCIETLYKKLSKEIGERVEIIVVDNGSDKEDVKKLQDLRDEMGFRLLLSDINLGFAAGCNFGSQMASGEILLFLNSDALVENGVISMAEQIEREENLGALGGKIISPSGEIEKSAGKFYNLWHLFLMLIGGERFGIDRFAPQKFEQVDWVSGGFMMVRKDIFDSLSGFDESYFMYLEDMDYCLRAKKAGHKTYYFPDASVIHKKHGSSNRQFAIVNVYKSFLTYYKKNTNKMEYNVAVSLLFTKALVAYLFGVVLGRGGLRTTYSQVLKLF